MKSKNSKFVFVKKLDFWGTFLLGQGFIQSEDDEIVKTSKMVNWLRKTKKISYSTFWSERRSLYFYFHYLLKYFFC